MSSADNDDAVALLGPAEIRDLAGLLNLQPTKKLGQNFVVDANTVRKIVSTGGVRSGETVLEVGPGLGSLTLGLLAAGADVVAVEIDPRLAAQLPLTVSAISARAADQLTVVTADAMSVRDLPGQPTRLVANLPYNVSVPVLLHLLHTVPSLHSGVVMVQAEVGHRIAADPGSRVYGAPSVKAAWYGEWKIAGTISRQVFWPVPNVDSVLVSFARYAEPRGTEAERQTLFGLVDSAFGQRRKMLRQSLASFTGDSARAIRLLAAAGVEETARGEALGINEFHALARAWNASA